MTAKIILGLASLLPAPNADKTQWFVHLSFNLTLQLINGISSDLQRSLRYFDGTEITVFKISFALLTSAFPKYLIFYIIDFKLLVSSKLVASSLE